MSTINTTFLSKWAKKIIIGKASNIHLK